MTGVLSKAESAAMILYMALDSIDTAGDMFKPEITGYFKAVESYHKKRHLVATTDGYTVKFKFSKLHQETRTGGDVDTANQKS